ncbi:hypothetical protein HOLleu_22070 [Holothuria leucospilota]|uniref:Uncharacterized protein n=1 Tax=Holothuria leucospilota TaxID=206669 RepID=A0A9Q1BYM4_HOLLE|nr:hypothetical protein HOLleu_22070 [Holothuria leucospilota]
MWGYHRSKSKIFQKFPRLLYGSPEVKKQNIPRIFKIVIWGHWGQKSTFPKNSQDHHLSYQRPKFKSKISQEFPRFLHGVTRGQKVKFPKNSQDSHQESPEVKQQNIPSIPKIVI